MERSSIATAWSRCLEVASLNSLLDQGCTDAQQLWDGFQQALRSTFLGAFISVAERPLPAAKMQAKGRLAKVSWESQACKGPRLSVGSMASRKKRRLLARLHEYLRISIRVEDGTASTQEAANLQALTRVLGSPSLRNARELIRVAKAELDAHDGRVKTQQLRMWRERLLSSTAEVARWLRAKEWPVVHCLSFTSDDGQEQRC